jgi:hypothetical protein
MKLVFVAAFGKNRHKDSVREFHQYLDSLHKFNELDHSTHDRYFVLPNYFLFSQGRELMG